AERAAINRGAFHQGANLEEASTGPIGVHGSFVRQSFFGVKLLRDIWSVHWQRLRWFQPSQKWAMPLRGARAGTRFSILLSRRICRKPVPNHPILCCTN